MPLSKTLRDFLEANRAQFTHTTHSNAFTARAVASAEHLPAREVAKTVVVHGDGGYFLLVLPANRQVDFREVRAALAVVSVRMATEHELGLLFPDCELGALPAIGSLYGLRVYLDESLAAERYIAFCAGTHRDEIHMTMNEYRRLVDPRVVSLIQLEPAHGW
jgi:Ala-tRNA(Pro) deacylase